MKFLLDANVLVCSLNDTGRVRGRLNDAQASGARILTSAVVVGELSFGASASARPEQNHARLGLQRCGATPYFFPNQPCCRPTNRRTAAIMQRAAPPNISKKEKMPNLEQSSFSLRSEI